MTYICSIVTIILYKMGVRVLLLLNKSTALE